MGCLERRKGLGTNASSAFVRVAVEVASLVLALPPSSYYETLGEASPPRDAYTKRCLSVHVLSWTATLLALLSLDQRTDNSLPLCVSLPRSDSTSTTCSSVDSPMPPSDSSSDPTGTLFASTPTTLSSPKPRADLCRESFVLGRLLSFAAASPPLSISA